MSSPPLADAAPADSNRAAVPDGLRHRRLHFDTERECVDASSGRIAAGWTLRLFALHDKGAHPVTGCPCCGALALELRRVVETVLPDDELEVRVDVGILAPALYESSAVPGRDEVALAVRIWPRAAGSPGGAADEAHARHVRERLKRYGLSES